jgi:hypothetical protein
VSLDPLQRSCVLLALTVELLLLRLGALSDERGDDHARQRRNEPETDQHEPARDQPTSRRLGDDVAVSDGRDRGDRPPVGEAETRERVRLDEAL